MDFASLTSARDRDIAREMLTPLERKILSGPFADDGGADDETALPAELASGTPEWEARREHYTRAWKEKILEDTTPAERERDCALHDIIEKTARLTFDLLLHAEKQIYLNTAGIERLKRCLEALKRREKLMNAISARTLVRWFTLNPSTDLEGALIEAVRARVDSFPGFTLAMGEHLCQLRPHDHHLDAWEARLNGDEYPFATVFVGAECLGDDARARARGDTFLVAKRPELSALLQRKLELVHGFTIGDFLLASSRELGACAACGEKIDDARQGRAQFETDRDYLRVYAKETFRKHAERCPWHQP